MRSIAEQRNTIGCVNFLSNKAITIIPGASSTPLTQGFPPDANLEILAAIRARKYTYIKKISQSTPYYSRYYKLVAISSSVPYLGADRSHQKHCCKEALIIDYVVQRRGGIGPTIFLQNMWGYKHR